MRASFRRRYTASVSLATQTAPGEGVQRSVGVWRPFSSGLLRGIGAPLRLTRFAADRIVASGLSVPRWFELAARQDAADDPSR